MKPLALKIAVMCFFVLAFVGWFSEVPVFVCGMRAVGGAFVLYVVLRLAGGAVIGIAVSAATKGVDQSDQESRT